MNRFKSINSIELIGIQVWVAVISKLCLMKGQWQVKLGQSRSTIQIQNFLTTSNYLVQFCLRMPENVIYFHLRQAQISNIVFKKSGVINFIWCLMMAPPKIKMLLWNLVYALYVCRFTTNIPFFITPKFCILKAYIFFIK